MHVREKSFFLEPSDVQRSFSIPSCRISTYSAMHSEMAARKQSVKELASAMGNLFSPGKPRPVLAQCIAPAENAPSVEIPSEPEKKQLIQVRGYGQ